MSTYRFWVCFLFWVAATSGAANAASNVRGDIPVAPGHVAQCVSNSDVKYATTAAKVIRYPDGGRSYTYRAGKGDEETTLTIGQPPSGFRPESASDAELARYSFPDRPDDFKGQLDWIEMVSSFRSAAPPEVCEGPTPPRSNWPKQVKFSGLAGSRNWSGYVANAPGQTGYYVAARGTFYQPHGNKYPSCKPHALVANWVGLGGKNTGALIQTGTGTAVTGAPTAWTVWTAGSSYVDHYYPGLVFGPDSYMKFYAGYNKAIQTVYFYLENGSTGQVIPVTANISANYYDGTSAESITERPSASTGLYPLLNYGWMTWWNVTVQNKYNIVNNIGDVNHLQMLMTRTGVAPAPSLSELLSYPEQLSLSQNYGVRYFNCQ